jgi:hypothetical protein
LAVSKLQRALLVVYTNHLSASSLELLLFQFAEHLGSGRVPHGVVAASIPVLCGKLSKWDVIPRP